MTKICNHLYKDKTINDENHFSNSYKVIKKKFSDIFTVYIHVLHSRFTFTFYMVLLTKL